MPRYAVTLEETVLYTITVDAEDEEAAKEIAAEEWAQSPDPTHDFCGSGNGVDVIEVEETGEA